MWRIERKEEDGGANRMWMDDVITMSNVANTQMDPVSIFHWPFPLPSFEKVHPIEKVAINGLDDLYTL